LLFHSVFGPERWLCSQGSLGCLRSRQELVFKGGDAPALCISGRLFFAEQLSELLELCLKCGLRSFAILKARFEFAFAQGEDMRAEVKILLSPSGVAHLAVDLLLGAPAAFVERSHPKGLGDVRNRLGEPVKCRWAGIEARRQALPPGVEQRIDRVGRTAANSLADFFDRGALPLAQKRVGGEFDISAGDAVGGYAVARRERGRFRHVL
jgi:hypothetical protein